MAASPPGSTTMASPALRSAAYPAGSLACAALPIPKCRSFPASPARGRSHFDHGVFVTRHILIGALVAALLSEAASADTLREALNSTYASNPTLNAQRESLKSTDATVAIARAGG